MGWLRKLFGGGSVGDRAERIVGRGHVMITDGESVDSASDYVTVVAEIAAITGGLLRFDTIACVEDDGPGEDDDADQDATRVLTLTQAGRTWTGRLQGRTDWIDETRARSPSSVAQRGCIRFAGDPGDRN